MGDRENRGEVVSLVYYLSRNGHLEHPHFIQIPLSSPRSLFLRDVIHRLNLLRGKGMASQYSWSSKRSYKNGYVWHDLEENDFIHPVHGGDYVLKGSEILQTISKSPETTSSSGDSDFPAARIRNQSWDLHEYKVYRTESTRVLPGKAAADASTQTEEKRRRKAVTELRKEEISPPPSDSSPETLESLMKADGRIVKGSTTSEEVNPTAGECPSGRMKASTVLMSLISCGSMSFRESGATEHGVSMVSSYSSSIGKMGLEDKEYFSGSVIDNKEDQFSTLKRSNSYNDDLRKAHMKLGEKEDEEVRVKCIPRRPKITQETSESGSEWQC